MPHGVTIGAMVDVRRLSYLFSAAESGSFRKAAQTLNVNQSTVSRTICSLEDELGVSLFERSHAGARLTDAGERFVSDAFAAVEQLQAAKRIAAAAGRAELGVVRVGILTSLAGGFLRELIRNYAMRHPRITIDIRDGGRDEHVGAIRRRMLDVAFVTGDRHIADCETAPLWEERIHVALPKEHKLASRQQIGWSDLRSECFIVSRFAPGPDVHDYIIRRAADYSPQPKVLYKSVVQETLMNLVGLGQGITLVSAAWVDVKLPDLVLRPLTDPAVPFSAVWSPQNDNPALRRFISVAHTLAGRVRRGTSDWSSEMLGPVPIKNGTSEAWRGSNHRHESLELQNFAYRGVS